MKGMQLVHLRRLILKTILLLGWLMCGLVCAQAQYLVQTDGENAQQRITRARALAAVGNLPAARSELESLSHAQADESVHEIALVLLVGVYLEQADYGYAENLLNETFTARQAHRESATHTYFALAGRVINGVRTHLERYRALGLDVTDTALPPEAANDLDRLRTLLERVVAHGKQLGTESGNNLDAAALIEEAAGVRERLARTPAEHAQWQRELADARQRLAGSTAHLNVSTLSQPTPRTQPVAATPPPADTNAPAPTNTTTAQPAPSTTAAADRNQITTPPANTNAAPAGSATNAIRSAAAADTNAAAAATSAGSASIDKSAQPLNVGASLITLAKDKIAPSYPTQARAARITGSVTVFLTVDEKGVVAAVQHADGPELLRRAAEDAARRWKFRPTLVNGQPVRVSGYINFNFAL